MDDPTTLLLALHQNMNSTESWIRRKIRAIYLKSRQGNGTKDENFRKLKPSSDKMCCMVANSSLGIWAKVILSIQF